MGALRTGFRLDSHEEHQTRPFQTMDPHTLAWPLELGLWTLMLRCDPSTWGDGLSHFGMAPQDRVMDAHASAWPLELGRKKST